MSLAPATRTARTRLTLVALLALTACAGEPETAHDDEAHEPTTSRGLALGDRGPDVRKLYDYLTRYGYFPNDELSERYPGFEPLVAEAPADPELYDPQLEQAVRKFQEYSGIAPTGSADGHTLSLMAPRSCDHPDGYRFGEHTHGEKFAVTSRTAGLTWSIRNVPPGLSLATYTNLIKTMIDQWSAIHPGEFSQAPAGTGNMDIVFRPIDGRGQDTNNDGVCDTGCIGARRLGSVIEVDDAEPWEYTGEPTTSVPWAQRKIDFRSTFLHEWGHALGIDHSDRSAAVMFWSAKRGTTQRVLTDDDRTAIRASAAKWVQISTPTTLADISATPLLMISTQQATSGGGAIYSFASGSWQKVPGSGAVRISGDTRWRPWIVRNDGSIAVRRQDNSAWIEIAGCARDIGVGRGRYAFVVGCDGFIYIGNMDAQADDNTLNSQRNLNFTQVPHSGPAMVALAAHGTSNLAAIDSNGNLWGFTGASMVQIPIDAPQTMGDIGAAPDSIWGARKSLTGVYALNLQSQILDPNGELAVPSRSGWRGYSTQSAQRVAVTSSGKPYVVDTSGRLWSTSK